jgi:anti-sigma regulatory factor (Ser/Thr protein kinase)
MDNNLIFSKSVKTENDARLKLIDEVIDFTKKLNLDLKLDRYEYYLVLDEAITNSMEHGNRWKADKSIHLKTYFKDKYLYIVIKDEGIGFNSEFAIKNYKASSKVLSPRGRGIFIIRKFCKVSWNSIGNEITLRINAEKKS